VTRGLVIGKFMPLHAGHIALIKFAASQCDEVIVSVSYKSSDEIPGPLRLEWLKEEFQDQPSIKPIILVDNFDDEGASIEKRVPLWKAFIEKSLPLVHRVFSSEDYGPVLAEALGAGHHAFDPPISGSAIRAKPFLHWDYIAPAARPYFVKKICFYGPESTGKSTIATKMAAFYNTEFVPEVSREIIDSNNFTVDDIIKIGKEQTARVQEKTKMANKLLFCDSDLITTQIYCRYYLKQIPPILFELEKQISYDRYFLFDIDVPWVADGLRDLGERRDEMFNIFKEELNKRKIPYDVLKGDFAAREAQLIKEINTYFH
jgi:HTH-type transcriptional repressor of NAD biosynthesis genes